MTTSNGSAGAVLTITPKPPEAWATPDPNRSNGDSSDFVRNRNAVLTNARYTCTGCGVRSNVTAKNRTGYLDVHHVDGDHGNSAINNLRPLCQMCHAVMHVGFPGELMPRGELVVLPSVSQVELNRLAWGALKASTSAEYGVTAKRVMSALRSEGRRLRSKTMPGFDGSPSVWSAFCSSLYQRERMSVIDQFEALTSDLRLFPILSLYRPQVEHLSRQVMGALPECDWLDLLE